MLLTTRQGAVVVVSAEATGGVERDAYHRSTWYRPAQPVACRQAGSECGGCDASWRRQKGGGWIVSGFERFSPVERMIELSGEPLHIWHPPDIDTLIDVAAFEADERIPYWAKVWESAVVLAEDLAVSAGGGMSLIELGCGLGVPALVAARRGFMVTATDYEEAALEGVRFNAERNGLGGRIDVRILDWRFPPEQLGPFDRLVAADVLYERHHAGALAAVIDLLLAPCGLALVADPGRPKAEAFPPACLGRGLVVETQPARRPQGATGGPEVVVYRVTRSATPPVASREPRR
jgi:predicted nicotinamide N-methyase